MTSLPRQSDGVEAIARTTNRHEIRKSEEGVFIKPGALDNDGEMHFRLGELGAALQLIGYNRADLFPDS
jgi:hypothetical protein